MLFFPEIKTVLMYGSVRRHTLGGAVFVLDCVRLGVLEVPKRFIFEFAFNDLV